MSTETKYTCDICGATQDTSEQFWAIKLAVRHPAVPGSHGGVWTTEYDTLADACRACMKRLHILPTEDPELKVAAEEATPAEKLVAIIQAIARGEVEA